MKVAVSTIAFADPFDEGVLTDLRTAGVAGIEVAPTMIWPDINSVTTAELAQVRSMYADHGLAVIAMQALLYGRPDVTLFGDETVFLEHLETVCRIGGGLGAHALVFGSPKNRLRGVLSETDAMDRAVEVFQRAGARASEHGTAIVIEPNPEDYGADFITTASDATTLVRRVDHPGVRLHLDTACLRLAGTDLVTAVHNGADVLAHFHVSEPGLAPVPGDGLTDHSAAAAALRDVGYDGYVSVEMRRGDSPEVDRASLARATAFAMLEYGDA